MLSTSSESTARCCALPAPLFCQNALKQPQQRETGTKCPRATGRPLSASARRPVDRQDGTAAGMQSLYCRRPLAAKTMLRGYAAPAARIRDRVFRFIQQSIPNLFRRVGCRVPVRASDRGIPEVRRWGGSFGYTVCGTVVWRRAGMSTKI